MKDLVIVGTSHIAQQSIKEVTDAVEKEKPNIIALELDRGRLAHLLNPKATKPSWRDIKHVGFKGWAFARFGAWAEKALGKHVGVKPGQDMLTAVRLARDKKLPLALVDQDIAITLRRFSRSITYKEKWNFLVDILKGIFLPRKELAFDLRTVPSRQVIAKLIGQVKKRYPNVYKVLVTERNHIMARNLARLMKANPGKKVLAVVGAGHEEELEHLVKKRLEQLS